MEFSKKLLIVSGSITAILSVLLIWFSIKFYPLDGLVVVVPLSWAETGAATAFYYWKAKNENRAKYGQMFMREFASRYEPDVAVRIAEVVLKD
jgi:hypothetical protein